MMKSEDKKDQSPQETVKHWLQQITEARKEEQYWRESAKDVIDIYRGEFQYRAKGEVNILWANVSTLKPAIYSRKPIPDIRARQINDQASRISAEVLNESLKHSIDIYNLDRQLKLALLDYLLPGRGVVRVRYVPVFETREVQTIETSDGFRLPKDSQRSIQFPDAQDQQDSRFGSETLDQVEVKTEEEEFLSEQKVFCEHVHWENFALAPAVKWEDVTWIAFRHWLTPKAAKEQYPGSEDVLGFEWDAGSIPDVNDFSNSSEQDNSAQKVAEVWEIWDKEERKVYHIAPSIQSKPLLEEFDPYGLEEFFPIPRPVYALDNITGTMVPTAEYELYRQQADELSLISTRIRRLIAAIKARGLYDASLSELKSVLHGNDNELFPAQNMHIATERGALENSIWMLPIGTFSNVLNNLYVQRDQLKSWIFEITGITDIQRGATRASETATAQQLKAEYSGLRLRARQEEFQRFSKDLIGLMAELMAENFTAETFSEISRKPVHPMVIQQLSGDKIRNIMIDIETDSTIQPDMDRYRKRITDFMQAFSNFSNGLAPMVQAGLLPVEAYREILLATTKGFEFGKDVEAAIGLIGQQQQQQQVQQAQQAQQSQQVQQPGSPR